MSRPSGWSPHITSSINWFTRSGGESSMLLISSMITWRSRSISSAVEARAGEHVGQHVERQGEMLAGHDGEIVGILASGRGVQRAADALDGLRDFLRAAAACACP